MQRCYLCNFFEKILQNVLQIKINVLYLQYNNKPINNTIMKTLDEIIKNGRYEKLNGALVARSIELADKVRQAMWSAEVEKVGDYSIKTVISRSGISVECLYILTESGEYRCLEADGTIYFAGDYNCRILAARGCDRLQFLNCARTILDKIEAIKEKRIKEINEVLEKTENL